MSNVPAPSRPLNILGAGVSGLTAATVLALTGREVHVHELRSDCGARFEGDFQGIENWTSPVDLFEEMVDWGLDPTAFRATPFQEANLVLPDGTVERVVSRRPAFRMVERGTAPHTLDQGLKRQALAAGVHLHFNARVEPRQCDIIATGPKQATGLVRGELFHTSWPDHVTLQFNDRLAPGAYTYLIVIRGVGLIATVLMRKQRDPDRFLNETVAFYERLYPHLERRPIRRLGGVGCFAINRRFQVEDRHYVGEAGGMQDCLWGFGIRHAMTSGYLAARALLGGPEYEAEVARLLRPLHEASLANRWLWNRFGEFGAKIAVRRWLRSQHRHGDSLPFLSRLYRPSWFHRLLYRTVAQGMLEAVPKRGEDDDLGQRYMPFRPARPIDRWTPSPEADRIGARWAL